MTIPKRVATFGENFLRAYAVFSHILCVSLLRYSIIIFCYSLIYMHEIRTFANLL